MERAASALASCRLRWVVALNQNWNLISTFSPNRWVTFVRKLSRTFHTWFLFNCVWYFLFYFAGTQLRYRYRYNLPIVVDFDHTREKCTRDCTNFCHFYWSGECTARYGNTSHQLHQLVVVRHPCLLRLTVVRRSLAVDPHRQSHMRKEAACKANSERRDSTTQHPTTAHFRALSFFCSLLSLWRPHCLHVCERVSESLRVCVCFLFAHTFVAAHKLTEGGDRFVFVGFNGAALCMPVCACDYECVWLAGK